MDSTALSTESIEDEEEWKKKLLKVKAHRPLGDIFRYVVLGGKISITVQQLALVLIAEYTLTLLRSSRADPCMEEENNKSVEDKRLQRKGQGKMQKERTEYPKGWR